jgi:hypothetical protein
MSRPIHELPEAIYEVLTNDTHHGHTDPKVAAAFLDRVYSHYDRAVGNDKKDRTEGVIYASEVGRPCARQVWYKFYTPQDAEPISGAARFKFLYGDLIEELTLELVEAAGYEVTARQERFEVDIPDTDWKVSGRNDCIIDGYMVDVKSASKFAFQKYKTQGLNDNTDSFGYRAQLHFYYMGGLASGLLNHPEQYLLMVSKELGNIQLVAQDNSYTSDRWIDQAREKAKALDNPNEPPERCFKPVPEGKSGNTKLGVECSYCEFRKKCWPQARTFIYSKGPVYLIDVVREPNVMEVKDAKS